MSLSPHLQAVTLLRTHRKRLEALAPAGLHSVIVAAPEPAPPTFYSIEDPDAGDGDFLPLPPRLWHESRLEVVGLSEVASSKRELIYFGDAAALKAYRPTANELARTFERYFDLICPDESGAGRDKADSRMLYEDMYLIHLFNSVGAISKSHSWTLAVHHVLERANSKILTGHYSWWSEPTRDLLPNEPEQEFASFADFAKSLPTRDPRLDRIINTHALMNDLFTSSLVAIDAMIEVLEEGPGRLSNAEVGPSAEPSQPPLSGVAQSPAVSAAQLEDSRHPEPSAAEMERPGDIGGPMLMPGYLGLVIDHDRRTVGRDGHAEVVRLAKRILMWGLLLKLHGRRDSYCPMGMIRDVWAEFGRSDDPDIGTIYDAISELRRVLEPLGITIDNAPTLGWRLEASPPRSGGRA